MAIDNKIHEAFSIAKDSAVSEVDIILDPGKWSQRKKNIIVKAVDLGVAQCGYDTAMFVKALTKTYGIGTEAVHYWSSGLDVNLIKPEKVEEAVAYVAALIRLKDEVTWLEERFMSAVESNLIDPTHIPIPNAFSNKDKAKFIVSYLKPQEEADRIIRDKLINDIRSGTKLTISFTI